MGSQLRVWVLVLGDVGRSPRMQYHATSLLQQTAAGVCIMGVLSSLDGLRPELVQAYSAGRLQLAGIPEWCASSSKCKCLVCSTCSAYTALDTSSSSTHESALWCVSEILSSSSVLRFVAFEHARAQPALVHCP
jgi:hypothetical protein